MIGEIEMMNTLFLYGASPIPRDLALYEQKHEKK